MFASLFNLTTEHAPLLTQSETPALALGALGALGAASAFGSASGLGVGSFSRGRTKALPSLVDTSGARVTV